MARKRTTEAQYETARKKRKVANPFIDDAAAEGSDDEEAEVGVEPEVEFKARDAVRSPSHPALRQRTKPAFFDQNGEIDEEFFKTGYGDGDDDDEGGDDDDEDDGNDQDDNDQDDNDDESEERFNVEDLFNEDQPKDGEKWWMLRCKKPATQKELLKRLDGFKNEIRKIIVPSMMTGYVYVHPIGASYIQRAVGRLAITVTMVPPSEVRQVLRMEKPKEEAFIWGRVKTGTYKGDLAEVIKKVDHDKVSVKLVPRVDLAKVAEKLENGKSTTQDKKPNPEKKFINWDEFERLGLAYSRSKHGTRVIAGTGIEVEGEYVVKTISLKNLKKTTPTIPELEQFNARVDANRFSRTKEQFCVTDTVIVVQGDLKNIKGTVNRIDGNIVHVDVEKLGCLSFNPQQLAKYFAIGDNVRVVSGKSKGSCGSIVQVLDDSLVMVTNNTKDSESVEELKVFKDLVEHYVPDVEMVDPSKPKDVKMVDVKNAADASPRRKFSTEKRSHGRRFSRDKRSHGRQFKRSRGDVVRVFRGPHKGYVGRVLGSNLGFIRLEAARPLQVREDDVVDYVEPELEDKDEAGSRTPMHTPMHTPMYTPMYTPMHPGLRTPMYDN